MNRKMVVAIFMGTRPEAIKMSPIIKIMETNKTLTPVVISTGQHQEILRQVTDMFMLDIDHDLSVMQPSQTLASLSSSLMIKVDSLLDELKPDICVVQGDTTSAFMVSLASFYRKIPVAHVEAGLRTGDLQHPFPEEANRRMISVITKLHFCPTELNRNHLLDEGIDPATIYVTGNTVIDALKYEMEIQESDPDVHGSIVKTLEQDLGENWEAHNIVLVTGHRRENFGQGLQNICLALQELSKEFNDYVFVYPVHPNPNVKELVFECLGAVPNVKLIAPQSYRSFVALLKTCKLVLTDSGGVQEEAPALGKPVLVMRETTERPEGVEAKAVKLVGTDVNSIVESVRRILTSSQVYDEMSQAHNLYGDGTAAHKIVDAIESYLKK